MNKVLVAEKEKCLSKIKAVKIYKKVLSGKIPDFPEGYWSKCSDKEECVSCIRYMVEVVLGWDESKYRKLTKRLVKEYKLGGMLVEVFEGNVFELVDYMYPDKYYEWFFRGRESGYWSKVKVIWAVKCVFEKNRWTKSDISEKYNRKFIVDNGLEYAVKKFYDNNIYDVLIDAYAEEEIKIWELDSVPKSFWTKETAIQATIWMINKLGWTRKEVKKYLNKKTFQKYRLSGMLKIVYNNSVYEAINAAYPGEYKRYEVGVSKGYWTEETVILAIHDMVKDLSYSQSDIKSKLKKKDFKSYKLEYPIRKIFEGSYYEAINAAYPGEYRQIELRNFKSRKCGMNDVAKNVAVYEY